MMRFISDFWKYKWRDDGMTKPVLRRLGGHWLARSSKDGALILAYGSRPWEAYFNLWALPNGRLCPIPLDAPSCP